MSFKEKIKNMKRKDGSGFWEMPEAEDVASDEIEYDEKGLIKRSGYDIRKGPMTFGKEFEEENFEKTFKPILIFLICFFVISVAVIVFALKSILF